MQEILNANTSLAEAEKATGLRDYGDASLPDRFSQAVSLIRKGDLDERGQAAAAQVCHWLLTTRLRFFEDQKRYPIADEIIERPLFATGEARSGTTLLHALLSADPNARSLRFWELMYPSPPPGLADPGDPRREKADEDWREILRELPRWLISHPYNDMLGDGLPECERTWAFDFRVMTPTAWWRVPMSIVMGGLPTDPDAQYRIHKMMLQHCQYNRPRKHWALKGFHQHRLEALFNTYPDAAIIWVHRDPVKVLASRIVLLGELETGLTGHVDWKEMSNICLAAVRQGCRATLNDPRIEDPRIHHVRYKDFVSDPVATIQGFYQKYDVPFDGETEAAMRNYLRANKADRYGKFKYSTKIISADIDKLDDEFAPYRERFGIDKESRN